MSRAFSELSNKGTLQTAKQRKNTTRLLVWNGMEYHIRLLVLAYSLESGSINIQDCYCSIQLFG
jgi:hypothetical protein